MILVNRFFSNDVSLESCNAEYKGQLESDLYAFGKTVFSQAQSVVQVADSFIKVCRCLSVNGIVQSARPIGTET